MSTTSQEEPITCESVLRFVKQQTEAFSRALAEQGAEFDRRIAEERRLLEEESKQRKEESKRREEESKRREEESRRREEAYAAEIELRKKTAVEEEARRQKAAAEEEARRQKAAAEEEARLKKSSAELEKWKKEMRSQVGGIGKSNGAYAEQFFIRAMKRSQTLAGIKFNWLEANYNIHGDGINEEYDIVLHNGEYIAIIEIKYKFEKDDLSTFIHRKIPNFRKIYPDYADKKIILGIAGFSFEDDIIDKARAMGIAVLHKDGKNVEYDDTNLKVF